MSIPVLELARQFKDISRKTRTATGVSTALHLLLFLCLFSSGRRRPPRRVLRRSLGSRRKNRCLRRFPQCDDDRTDAGNRRRDAEGRAVRQKGRRRFSGDVVLDPQRLQETDDKINDRLASLQRSSSERRLRSPLWRSRAPRGSRDWPACRMGSVRNGTGLKRGKPGPPSSGIRPSASYGTRDGSCKRQSSDADPEELRRRRRHRKRPTRRRAGSRRSAAHGPCRRPTVLHSRCRCIRSGPRGKRSKDR